MIGVRLGPWIVEQALGRGGMGAVYLARRDPPADGLSDRAAIKVLAAELSVEDGFLLRFQREIDVLRQLDHPHIVRFLESGAEGGRYYYVMEYVAGPSYEDLRLRDGRLPWPEVFDLAWQVAPALKHAHDRGVVHRDIKPSNLLRGPADRPDLPGVVKLTDFGIASLFASPHLTVTGGVIGTPEYLSPEQAAGKPVTRRSDLYSLGVVLYTLVTGRTPFEGEPLDLLHKHRFGQFDRPSRLAPDLPHDFEEVICQLLEKEPSQRPGDGAVLFRRLDSLKRKYERQAAGPETVATAQAPSEGPATLMSRMMRGELQREKHGGPVRQLLRHPAVLVPLFLLTVGLIVWSLWPTGPDRLYARGAALMASADPDDWHKAVHDYFDPLDAKHPNHPYQDEVAGFRRQYEEHRAGREAERLARQARPMGEAEWAFHVGLRKRQEGDASGARRAWRALADAFREVPAERPWVKRAEEELEKLPPAPADERDWSAVRDALRRAGELRKEGKVDEARKVMRGLEALYDGDPKAAKVFKEGG